MPLIESYKRRTARRKEGNSGRSGPKTPAEMSQSGEPSFPAVPSGKVDRFNLILKENLIIHVGELNMHEVARVIPLIEGFPQIVDTSQQKSKTS